MADELVTMDCAICLNAVSDHEPHMLVKMKYGNFVVTMLLCTGCSKTVAFDMFNLTHANAPVARLRLSDFARAIV